ncbi:MAG TPA: GFA family protein [Sphingobium sp.]
MTEGLQGGCQCGAIRFEVRGEPAHVALCHCADCRRAAGAPVVAWSAFPEAQFTLLAGKSAEYNSSGNAIRSFCPTCGTGLFYRNPDMLPGLVDVQLATLDDPEALPPKVQVQTAERIGWMADLATIPAYRRWRRDEEG